MDRKVVVVGSVTIWDRGKGEMFAARFEPLKLTSYGRTKDDAEKAVRKQYARFVSRNRELGVIEKLLNKVGAVWYWEDEYPSDSKLPIEYFDGPEGASHSTSDAAGGYIQITPDLAMAA